jgi:glycosyltransferase involved in cell wall biosynthesis
VVEKRTGRTDVEICTNAVDAESFYCDARDLRNPSDRHDIVTVISYGGRDAVWKGFAEMAEAVSQVRRERPRVRLEWKVYGGALMPPKNRFADYEDLGYLDQRQLGDAYRDSDILLSASWYESFPLFPLEAMACGTATITSALGTEEYARHGETAHVIEPRNVCSIATGLLRLVDDHSYRRRLAAAGATEARRFTWNRAVARMDGILRDAGAAGSRTRGGG